MPTLPWQGVFAITGKLTLHLGVEAEVRRVVTCRLAVGTPQAALFLVLRAYREALQKSAVQPPCAPLGSATASCRSDNSNETLRYCVGSRVG